MMPGTWTFGRRLGLGFGAVVALSVVIGAVAVMALRGVVADTTGILATQVPLLGKAQQLDTSSELMMSMGRSFLLTGDEEYLARRNAAQREILTAMEDLSSAIPSDEGRARLASVRSSYDALTPALDRVMEQRRSGASLEAVVKELETRVKPLRVAFRDSVDALVALERRLLDEAQEASAGSAARAESTVLGITVALVLLALGIAVVLTRGLGRQVGSVVQRVLSSSAELQAAADQQANSAREQATAMAEIATTITQLLGSSRQIADSAQRVAGIAAQTAASTGTGESAIARSDASVAAIRRQVDLIVSHMLELGRKSQQIGAVLEIVSELADQTNILAINASIEAAGAGDAGKRFGVVADEIRKLADRVGGSTKEIRGLITDVQGAVNATVMTTETGSKEVEAGQRQFADVSSSFRQIAAQVDTTTEAAREIGLSTKQQTSAVEQVNIAISSMAQATRESEASSVQTQATASQLALLSRELMQLVRAGAGVNG